MAFRTTRGRPKSKIADKKDIGTAELRAKRAQSITCEPLDICLKKGFISEAQHWCGLHLRWLYTLRYGAPSVACRGYHLESGYPIRPEDDAWRSAREQEYRQAIQALSHWRCYEMVMSVCVFHHMPLFLNIAPQHKNKKIEMLSNKATREHEQFITGLEVLRALWRK